MRQIRVQSNDMQCAVMRMEMHLLQGSVHGLETGGASCTADSVSSWSQTVCLGGLQHAACTCNDSVACPGRTMTMEFTLTKGTPISKWWRPKLIFTGVSIMGVNPENKKFNRSVHDASFSCSLGHGVSQPRAVMK